MAHKHGSSNKNYPTDDPGKAVVRYGFDTQEELNNSYEGDGGATDPRNLGTLGNRSSQNVPNYVTQSLVVTRENVGICVQCGDDGGMAHPPLNVVHRMPPLQQQGGMSMPEVMKPHVRKTGLFQQPLEPAMQGTPLHQTTVREGTNLRLTLDYAALTELLIQKGLASPENIHNVAMHRNSPDAAGGLRFSIAMTLTPRVDHAASDMDAIGLKIDAVPLKAQDFTKT